MPLTAGQTLQNRYRIAALLGEGGMGAVYRAWDMRLDKPVALKEMVPQPGLDPASLEHLRAQFRQEAMTLGKLRHQHLVQVTDYFEEGESDYLVMEFVEGESLADRIQREGPLPEAQVIIWARQLLGALAYCHALGVIHRDIKPQNVIITPDGAAMLVDFGLVKLWDPADPRTKTVMRGAGTPEYAPPEQWGGMSQHTDPRSDLYSLGALLYHTLTGQAPPTASERMVYPKQFRAPRELNGRVSAPLDLAISRAMQLAIDDRWSSALEMAQGLPAAAQSAPIMPQLRGPSHAPTGTRRMPEASPAPQPVRRRVPTWRWVVGGGAVALVGLGLVVALVVALASSLGSGGETASPTRTPEPSATTTMAAAVVQQTPTPTAPARATSTVTPQPSAPPGAGPPTSTPGAEPFPVRRTATREGDEMMMVYVPSGTFAMGTADGLASESPVRNVSLGGFWIDQTEVTNVQFAAFLNAEGNQVEGGVSWYDSDGEYAMLEQSNGLYRPKGASSNHPVYEVSWYGARAYCAWVDARLPTETEWEYAARGPEGRTYPWGDEQLKGLANCRESDCEDGFPAIASVGSFPEGASWVGALDMAGNVAEWVADWYDETYYERAPSDNPLGPESGTSRGVRGGSWFFGWDFLRGARRAQSEPGFRNFTVGFRCAGGDPGN